MKNFSKKYFQNLITQRPNWCRSTTLLILAIFLVLLFIKDVAWVTENVKKISVISISFIVSLFIIARVVDFFSFFQNQTKKGN